MATYKVVNSAGDYRNDDAVKKVLHYAASPDKTGPSHVVGGSVIPEIAAMSMDTVASVYHNDNDTGPRLRHSVLSFAPGEISFDALDDVAQKAIGFYADRYQIVAAPHRDRDHPHIHFVMNMTSFIDGKKYHGEKSDYYKFQAHLNGILRHYGTWVSAGK